MTAAYQTGKYRNVFLECGYSKEEIQERVEKTFETIFYGTEEERFYHEVGEDMAYVEDTGNHDVRTEGMSYAMMVCVQMNRKEEFDRLWKWVRTYMYIPKGPGKIILHGRVALMELGIQMDRLRMEKNFLRCLYSLRGEDGVTEKEFLSIVKRQGQS